MRFGWLKTRQTKYSAYVAVYLLVIVAVLAAANWLAQRHNKSVDLTANKRFSLSDQTAKVVKNLKQDVKIVYFDKPGEYQRAKDLLERYDNLSPKLNVEYVDPDKQVAYAKTVGVRNFGSTFVIAGQKKEEAKGLTEEEVTGALIRALKSGDRNACLVQGSGEHGLDDSGRSGFSYFKDVLEKNNYKTRTISLLEKAEVPADCTVLIVGGPKKDYLPPQAEAVKKYVENGGRALLMLDPPLEIGRDTIAPNPELAKVVESWGITLDQDLVLDTSGIGQLFGLGPAAPLVANYESHAIVREMKGTATVFPEVRSLDTKGSAEKLFATTANSYATTTLNSPEIRIDPKKDKKGPLTLAAAANVKGADNKQGRVVVVGGSSWASNGFLGSRSLGNRDLLLNMMNWLSSDEDLIAIRPKDPENRPLSLSRSQMGNVRMASVFGLPALIIAGGILVWWRRR